MTTSRPAGGRGPTALASLRRYVRPRASSAPAVERCGLCDAALAERHSHLLEPATGRLACACQACALLFSGNPTGRYRLVPDRIRALNEFRLDDAIWDRLAIPIDLAFFVRGTAEAGVVAHYPSPAGATESIVPPRAWDDLADENPVLRMLEPEVEALLVNRVGGRREHYLVGIDECYRLVGLIRTKWRGLSGGGEVWEAIARLFDDLKRRAAGSGANGSARTHA
ncbi:MAG: DUF5947 family protein [Isosphaeraceae bacterium]